MVHTNTDIQQVDEPVEGGISPKGLQRDAHAARSFTARRDQIEHEDDLIGMRVNWLVAAETFLFVAYAILVNGSSYALTEGGRRNSSYSTAAHSLYELIPWLGVGLVVCVAISISAAIYASAKLKKGSPPPPKDFPPLTSSRMTHITGFSGAAGVPAVLLAAWLFVLTTR